MGKMGRSQANNNATAMKMIAAMRSQQRAEEGMEKSKPKKKGLARRVPRSKKKLAAPLSKFID